MRSETEDSMDFHTNAATCHEEERQLLTATSTPTGESDSLRSVDGLLHELENRRKSHQPKIRRNKWWPVLFGQLIAMTLASQNASSFTLEYGLGIVCPFFIMFNVYIVLALHLFYRESSSQESSSTSPSRCYDLPFTKLKLSVPWWSYLCLSFLDVGPNYMVLLSLKYTSLTSTSLLGALTIPSTMLACNILLKKVYKHHHYVGVILCMIGGCLTIWDDFENSVTSAKRSDTYDASEPHPDSFFGDLLALTAALLYGLGDAAGEFFVKHVDRVEYLGMLGLFGAIYTGVLFPFLEYHALVVLYTGMGSSLLAMGVIFWYIISVVVYYTTSSFFLISSDATLLNLSLQASNLWAVIYSIVVYQQSPSYLFFVSVLLVAAGVSVYDFLEKQPIPDSKSTSTTTQDYGSTHSRENELIFAKEDSYGNHVHGP